MKPTAPLEQVEATVEFILDTAPVERVEVVYLPGADNDGDTLPSHYSVIAWSGPEVVDMASHLDPLTAITRLARQVLAGQFCPDCRRPTVLFDPATPVIDPSPLRTARVCAVQYHRQHRRLLRLCEETRPP